MARAKFTLIPTRPVPLIGGLLDFDATTKRDRRRQGQVIMHPKESGLDPLTDDVILDPERISVTAHFVDYPLYYGPLQFEYPGRAKTLADSVRLLQEKKIPCIVLFGDDVLTSMVIASIGDSRGPDTGDAVDLDLEIVHVEIGELGLVQALVDAASQALGAEQSVDIGWIP